MAKRGFIFSTIRQKRVKRNAFNLSYENKLTCNMNRLVPFFVNDVLPADSFKVFNEYLMKCQPLIAPIMHRVDIYQHYFYVPLRLIWRDFELFITGGKDGSAVVNHPFITCGLFNSFLTTLSTQYTAWYSDASGKSEYVQNDTNSLWAVFKDTLSKYNSLLYLLDYLGYPFSKNEGISTEYNSDNDYTAYTFTPMDDSEHFSSLRIRAYFFIYDNYYIDENLGTQCFSDAWKNNNGSDNSFLSSYVFSNGYVKRRAWKKDYFTSALPFLQRGYAPNVPTDVSFQMSENGNRVLGIDNQYVSADENINIDAYTNEDTYQTGEGKLVGVGADEYEYNNLHIDNSSDLVVNFDINTLRRANALQRWLEKNARSGARYVEQVLSHFGIRPKDYRLDRPEYLGGGKQPFTVSEVVQTSETSDTPQANQAGNGHGYNQQHVFNQTFEEHGLIIGLLSVMPRASYQQGLSRLLTKFDKLDYAFPEFGNLGEQEVLSKELFFTKDGSSANDNVFGYQSRYAEYKYNFDQVHGDFKDSLKFWHLGRIFENRPLLNESFVASDASKRVFAVEDEDEDCLLFDFYNNVTVLRALPAYGTPAL